MKKTLAFFTVLLGLLSTMQAQIVISEIMYNPPESGTDSLEYIEILNTSGSTINLEGWSMLGVDLIFPSLNINAGASLLIAGNASAIQNVFGKSSIKWTGGSLSNGGETLKVLNAQGAIVDSVKYDDGAPWPTDAAGNGTSIELCNPNADNNSADNWKAGSHNTGVTINGKVIFATPGETNTASCLPSADHMVTVQNFFFAPADITINQGESVIFVNLGGVHNVNGSLAAYPQNPEGFYSGAPAPAPWNFIDTFNVPGVYAYRCDPHASQGMVGKITVLPAAVVKVAINEIMYNNPGTDSLEFVELLNYGTEAADISGWSFTQGVEHVFAAGTVIPAGGYLVLAKYPDVLTSYFGGTATKWTNGDLVNTGEDLELRNASNAVMDYLEYKITTPWPSDPNGGGSSLVLCDPNTDNGLPQNWAAASTNSGVVFGGVAIKANPGAASNCMVVVPPQYPSYTIGQINNIDATGKADSIGVTCTLEGIVHGVNLKPDGLNFYIINSTNTDGINVFKNTGSLGYTVTEGDIVSIRGKIAQFNGLVETIPDSITLVSSGNPTVTPETVINHSEATESRLITITHLMLVDAAEWTTGMGASGFRVRAVSMDHPNDTVSIRIDNDVDLYNMPAPVGGWLTVTGIGGQFDNSSPFTSGYQILPRYESDIQVIVDATYEADFSANVRISPNPVNDLLRISTDLEFDRIQLFSATGKLVQSIQNPNPLQTISTEAFSTGVYFVRFEKEGAFWTTRFVKM